MNKKHLMTGLIVGAVIAACGILTKAAEEKKANYPDPQRWSQDAETFARWDQKNTPPADPIVFVGSSSIRYWLTAEAFPDLPVINRGFGGSYMAESVYYADAFILKYRPKMVVVYAGDNDCAGGIPPERVVDDFKTLADTIHAALPNTEIVCLAVKLSNSRKEFGPVMLKTNELYKQYAETRKYITYVDGNTVLQAEDGSPDSSLFRSDQLHLNEKGYAAWNRLLTPILKQRYALAMSKKEK